MASKLQTISELSDQTSQRVTQNEESWKDYLRTASRLFKYPFDEQLLIYAQRPDATACASMELWNGTMRRWIKPRSKSISVIRKDGGGRPHLEYIFDYADTRPVRGAKEPYLWEMRDEHHESVVYALQQRYGPSAGPDAGWHLMELASRAAEEIWRGKLPALMDDLQNSGLAELDAPDLEKQFHDTLTASVQFTLLTRCGFDPDAYMNYNELEGITAFSTPSVLHHLGDATSIVSGDMLMEIGQAIRNYDRENQIKIQKASEKPLAKQPDISYNRNSRDFNILKRESNERSAENGRTDLYPGRRLPDSR